MVYQSFISSSLHQLFPNHPSVPSSRSICAIGSFYYKWIKIIHCTFANPTSCCPFQVGCTADDNICAVTAVALITNAPDYRTLLSNGAVCCGMKQGWYRWTPVNWKAMEKTFLIRPLLHICLSSSSTQYSENSWKNITDSWDFSSGMLIKFKKLHKRLGGAYIYIAHCKKIRKVDNV